MVGSSGAAIDGTALWVVGDDSDEEDTGGGVLVDWDAATVASAVGARGGI